MKRSGIIWGLFLVAMGVIFLLRTTGIMYFSWHAFWHSLWRMWPMILIFIGVSVIPMKENLRTIIQVLLIAVTTCFFIYTTNNYQGRGLRCHDTLHIDYSEDEHGEKHKRNFYSKNVNAKNLEIEIEATGERAKLEIDGGACSLNIHGSTADLFEWKGVETWPLQSNTTRANKVKISKSIFDEENDFLLNSDLIWNIEADLGAASIRWDFSDIKVNKLDIDGGASDITIKIGDLLPQVNMDIDCGVSNIKLLIPVAFACRLTGDMVLSDKNLQGFVNQNGYKQTANFDEAEGKIFIEIDSALSSLSIERY